MFKDIKFYTICDNNIYTRIFEISLSSILESEDYLFQIFKVVNVHYEYLFLKNPYKDKETLFEALKKINKDIEFRFVVDTKNYKNNKVELKII